MSEMVECPADGCEYGPKPRKSVVAHYSGTRDNAHKGGYQHAKQLIDGNAESKDAVSEPAESEPMASEGGGSDPAMESPQTDAEAAESTAEAEHIPNCPKCGGELVDYRQQPAVSVDFVCSQCGQGWDDE